LRSTGRLPAVRCVAPGGRASLPSALVRMLQLGFAASGSSPRSGDADSHDLGNGKCGAPIWGARQPRPACLIWGLLLASRSAMAWVSAEVRRLEPSGLGPQGSWLTVRYFAAMNAPWGRRCARCTRLDPRELWESPAEAHICAAEGQRAWYRRRKRRWQCPACGYREFHVDQTGSGDEPELRLASQGGQ
jgi:hypothetical protein